MKTPLAEKDLLFHPAHGVCRVSAVIKVAQTGQLQYSLLPITTDKGKIRFVIPESALEQSGFHLLISASKAQAILKYFKTGKKEREAEKCHAWQRAMFIRTESGAGDPNYDARKRQEAVRAVQGLASELAAVLETTTPEMAQTIQDSLGPVSDIHPLILHALSTVIKQ